MSSSPLSNYLAHLRGVLARREGAEHTDGQLLERYLSQRDGGAFEMLLCRHGPMVLAVCRRILGNSHDAEDAFQATFLVLVRRAGSIHPRDRVGCWLYGVASRTALEARRRRARRRRKETLAVPRALAAEDAGAEWTSLLDGELNRLPANYRLPILLCDLQGLTRKEAAQQLGWAEGTVSSRLSRGRDLLARRLKRHGLGLSVAAALAEGAAKANVPASLVATTVKTAMLTAAGQTAAARLIAAEAVSLMEKGVRAMYIVKLKFVAVVVLGVGLVGGLAYYSRGQQPDRPIDLDNAKAVALAAPIKAAAADDEEKVTVERMPPVVVRTVPQAGDTQVDADKVKEIRVTFSKKMMDKCWSWSQIAEETFPKTDGKPRYDKERRTCILPVKLEAGKTYVLWLNSARFGNFKDTDGRSAVPYLLVFQTKPKE
ncbi:MAG: RNA polymerase sigma factor [Gemmataceae bacterium]